VSPLPIWPSADLLLVNLDLTLPARGPETIDETPRMMPLAIDRGMSVRYSGLRLGCRQVIWPHLSSRRLAPGDD
jgi:hypothetical protein